MNLIEKLTYLKDKEYIVNSKFNVVIHLPIRGDDWQTNFDLVFFANCGTVMYKRNINYFISDIQIDDNSKTAKIFWK